MGVRDLFTAVLKADAKGIITELKDVSAASDGTAEKVKSGFGKIRDSVAGTVTSFVDAHPKIGGALGRIGIDSQRAGSAIGTALPGAAAAGAAALGAFAAKAVASTMQFDAGILAVQRTTGATAENASALVAIADDFGIGADQLSGALGKLAKNADSDVLAGFGVQLTRNADGTVDLYKSLSNLAEVFAGIKDPTDRAKLAQAAFGKSWQDLIPILEQGSAGLDDAYKSIGDGQIRTQEQIDASEKLRLTFDALSDAAGGLSIAVGSFLIPEIQKLGAAALSVKGALDEIPDGLTDIGGTALRSLNPLSLLGDSIDANNKFFDEMAEALGFADEKAVAYGGSIRAVTESTDKNARANREAAAAQKETEKATRDLEKADRDAAKQASDYARAIEGVRKELEARGKVLFELAGSLDAQERAEGRVADAVKELNRVEAEREAARAGKASKDYDEAKSSRELELAIYGVRDSYGAVAKQALDTALQVSGGNLTLQQQADVQVAALETLKGKFLGLTPEIDAYVKRLQLIPSQIVTDLVLQQSRVLGTGPQNVGAGNINIYLPPGVDGDKVVGEINRWQRRNGGVF